LEKKGAFIIGFAPPLASDVHKAVLEIPIQAEFFTDATAKTAELFQKNGWPFYDGTDPGRFGLDDRCMWDGIHAMETYHVALLNVMANDPKVRRALHLSPEYLQALLSDPRTTPWYPVYPAQRTAMVQR
jgi:hypothetical protein